MEEIVSRHGVPSEVLSDRGRAFLSGLMQEVERLLGFKKVNTTAYHPQTDGLVERYNRTLTAMLAKTVDKRGPEWDVRLPYVLFAYRACQQSSTQESPFFLLYGRDPRLPTPAVLSPKESRSLKDLKEYGVELYSRMSEAWELARRHITRAQKHQKNVYDRGTKNPFRAGERVFLFKPAEQTGARRKFARPFHGPYRLVEVGTNTARICPVDKPEGEPVLVSLDRLRRCPEEVGDKFWPPSGAPKRTRRPHASETKRQLSDDPEAVEGTGEWTTEEPGTQTEGDPNWERNPDLEAKRRPDIVVTDPDGHEEGRTTEKANGELLDPAAGSTPDESRPNLQTTADEAHEGDLDFGGVRVSLPSTQREAETVHEDSKEVTHHCGRKTTGKTAVHTQGSTPIAAGTCEMTTSQGEDVFQANMNPWTTAKDQTAELFMQQKEPTKTRRKRVEDSLSRKWTGRLRSSRPPRTATRQQGEM